MNNTIKTLIEEKWVIKSINKETYAEIKRSINDIRSLINEKLGWRIIFNDTLIKLEKIPATPRPFMGIEEFNDVLDYQLLCAILMFLEDKEDKSQFLLSSLTNSLSAMLKDELQIDWTDFQTRKSLVRVLSYCEKIKMIKTYDGDSDNYAKNEESEVLYENLGVSRYFATNYPFDVKEIEDVKDFNKINYNQSDEKGDLRTIRVYRELLTNPIFCWDSTNHPDGVYLRNQRRSLETNLNKILGSELYLSKNMASLIYLDENPIGDYHPRDNSLCDIVMGVCSELSKIALDGRSSQYNFEDDCFKLSTTRFEKIIIDFKKENDSKFSKEYRELNNERFIKKVKKYMEDWQFIEVGSEFIKVYQSINLIKGLYRG